MSISCQLLVEGNIDTTPIEKECQCSVDEANKDRGIYIPSVTGIEKRGRGTHREWIARTLHLTKSIFGQKASTRNLVKL